jgi:hypothetical protein
VIAGVNLVFAHNTSPWASILKIAVIVAGFALIAFGNFDGGNRWWPHYSYRYNSDSDDNDSNNDSDDNGNDDGDDSNTGKIVKVSGSSEFKEPFDASVKIARLNISGGATTFRMTDTTANLFKAETKEFHGSYQFDKHKDDSVYVMDFHMKNVKFWSWGNNDHQNLATISLNTNPQWELNIDAGATDLNFDLSKYKVRSVKLGGGAAQFVLKMGEPLATTNINVSTGASDVTINIPGDAACHIKSDTGLSSNTFDGFNKSEDGTYETAGFDAAKNKMYITISGGVSDFKVHKY